MITIYGNTNCVYCMMAKELAEDNELEFDFKNVDFPENIKEFKQKFPTAKTIPQIEWDGEHIGGYDEMVNSLYKYFKS